MILRDAVGWCFSISYVSIGYDCSAAGALRALGLRHEAYPFDWIQSHSGGIRQCLTERFARFHTEVRLMEHGRRVIDAYGFEFPHDYPVRDKEGEHNKEEHDKGQHSNQDIQEEKKEEKVVHQMGEAGHDENMYMEVLGKPIVPEWSAYLDVVREKYGRRIRRFLAVMENREKPVVVLSRYYDREARELVVWLRTHYEREDIYMVNTWPEESTLAVKGCITVYAERNGIWNEPAVWREGLERLMASI
jgi:hypothetical protein